MTDYIPEEDPMTLAVNRAFNTGEMVVWNTGDALPDPEGSVRRLDDEACVSMRIHGRRWWKPWRT